MTFCPRCVYGLTWIMDMDTTDSPSGYYGPSGPGTGPGMGAPYPGGPPVGGGRGGGGIQGGFASALQAVEGIAGRQTREQLEKTVKSLTNSGCLSFLAFWGRF